MGTLIFRRVADKNVSLIFVAIVNYWWTDWRISGAGDSMTDCFAENIIYATVNVRAGRFKRDAGPVSLSS